MGKNKASGPQNAEKAKKGKYIPKTQCWSERRAADWCEELTLNHQDMSMEITRFKDSDNSFDSVQMDVSRSLCLPTHYNRKGGLFDIEIMEREEKHISTILNKHDVY